MTDLECALQARLETLEQETRLASVLIGLQDIRVAQLKRRVLIMRAERLMFCLEQRWRQDSARADYLERDHRGFISLTVAGRPVLFAEYMGHVRARIARTRARWERVQDILERARAGT